MFLILYVIGFICLQVEITFFSQEGTLTTDISVQNDISIRLKYKTLIECSGLRCLRTIV